MHVTVKQLQLLSAIDRHRNVTAAARAANLSQPAVTQHMKQLEEQVGGPLWETVNRRLHLTERGHVVLAAASDVLSRLDRLEAELEAARGQIVGDLDIAVVTSAKNFMPHFLGEFIRLHPNVRPRLSVNNRIGVIEAMQENRHDLYIMGQVPERLKVEAVPILDNILEVVASADHPLRGRTRVPLAEIAAERFLVREAGSGTHIATEKLFARHRLGIRPYMELGSTGAIKSAVIAGLGIAVLSRHSLEYELKSNALCVLDVEGFPLHRSWYAAYPAGKRLSIAARSFFDFLVERTADYVPREEAAED